MSLSPERPQSQSRRMYADSAPRHPLFHLPVLYARAILRPSEHTFARAAEYASWGLVWLQLAILVLLPSILGWLRATLRDTSGGVDTHTNIFFGVLDVVTIGATIGAFILKIILVPLLFFIGVTFQYLLARIFKGQGRYVAHGFSMLLYLVPLTLISAIIITVFVYFHISTLLYAPIISIVIFCYGVLINVSVVRGVHHLSRDKAIATVAIPYIVGVLAVCGGLLALTHYLANTISSLH